MCLVPWSTCTLHLTLCTKCEFYNIQTVFSPSNESQIQIYLDRRVLMIVKLHPIKSKVNSPFNINKLFQFQNVCLSHSFQWVLLATCYNGWNISNLCNALWTGFKVSSGRLQPNFKNWTKQLSAFWYRRWAGKTSHMHLAPEHEYRTKHLMKAHKNFCTLTCFSCHYIYICDSTCGN